MKEHSHDQRADAIAKAIAVSDDFGHEMRVSALLHKYGVNVQHGWTYADPVEGKLRQFDFRAKLVCVNPLLAMRLAVEAKNLAPEAPLVISGTARVRPEAFHDRVKVENRNGHDFVHVLRSIADQPLYPVGGFVGKSVLRLKWDDKKGFMSSSNLESEIYNRWTQALASADQLCKEAAISTPQDRMMETVILPMVVLPNETLWTVEYSADGTPKGPPTTVEATNLFLNHEVVVRPHNNWMNLGHVNFYTLGGFETFLAALHKGNGWDDWFMPTAVNHQPPVH